jgi:hypothetical protein
MGTGGEVVARVVVALEVFQRGKFPPVCIKTGRPAELVGQVEAVAATGGVWSLVRLLPLLRRLWPANRRARGEVPIARAAVRRIIGLRWVWAVVLLAGVALTGAAGSGSPSMLAAGRVLVALAGVLWLLAPWVTVEARVDPDGGTVELYDVHPRFKAAVEQGPARETTPTVG